MNDDVWGATDWWLLAGGGIFLLICIACSIALYLIDKKDRSEGKVIYEP